jgi:hypothetical protein
MKLGTLLLLTLLMASLSSPAADAYPNQPKLSNAHRNLMSARRNLDRANVSGNSPSTKLLNEAVVSLNMARKNLEDAAKNKGSHRVAAMDRIEKAKAMVEKLRQGIGSASTVVM